jgi:hypothetical protein
MIHLIDLISIISLDQIYYKKINFNFVGIKLAYTLFIIIIIIINDSYFLKNNYFMKRYENAIEDFKSNYLRGVWECGNGCFSKYFLLENALK